MKTEEIDNKFYPYLDMFMNFEMIAENEASVNTAKYAIAQMLDEILRLEKELKEREG